MAVNRIRNASVGIIPFMEQPPSRKPAKSVLWENLEALMAHHYGTVNLNKLARDAKFGAATAARLKGQKTSVGLDVLDKLATAFKPIQAWQLLVPGLKPEALPVAAKPKPTKADIEKVEEMKRVIAQLTPEQRDLFLETEEGRALVPHYPVEQMDARKWSAAGKTPSRRSAKARKQ